MLETETERVEPAKALSSSAPQTMTLHELSARAEIANVLALHSRGVDRNDFGLLCAAYHPDAEVSYGLFEGPAATFARYLTDSMAGQPGTLHRTSNIWVKIEGERARSESYVIAYMRSPEGDGSIQRMIGGRYLDRHERRDGAWKIAHRTYVMDWNTNRPSTEAWGETAVDLAHFSPRGAQGAHDPGRALLAAGAALNSLSRATPMTQDANDLDRLASRAALNDLVTAYCRGVDRADEALLASLFHPDATVVTGLFNGDGATFARNIAAFVRNDLRRAFHSVANSWFEIDGDRAVGETYVIAFTAAGEQDGLIGGRYADRFERRYGVWKFAQRTFIADWNVNQPSTHDQGEIYAQLPLRGAFAPDDPVYALWGG